MFNGLNAGCKGGDGGPGGLGGPGCGGRSLGVDYTGTASTIDMKQITTGTAGKGGPGGNGNLLTEEEQDDLRSAATAFR